MNSVSESFLVFDVFLQSLSLGLVCFVVSVTVEVLPLNYTTLIFCSWLLCFRFVECTTPTPLSSPSASLTPYSLSHPNTTSPPHLPLCTHRPPNTIKKQSIPQPRKASIVSHILSIISLSSNDTILLSLHELLTCLPSFHCSFASCVLS